MPKTKIDFRKLEDDLITVTSTLAIIVGIVSFSLLIYILFLEYERTIDVILTVWITLLLLIIIFIILRNRYIIKKDENNH